MEKIDWSTYKFHCSGIKNLMVNSRKKDDLLSETTKSYLREIWIKETFKREKSDMVNNRYTQKGIMCETDSLELVERVTGKKYFKNQETLSNEWVVGTPDVKGDNLIDIKTSWDLFTFAAITEDEAKKDYYYQILAYMWLLNKKTASLYYCLVNTPDIIMSREIDRLSYTLPEEEINKYKNNYIFDDIPESMRIKSYQYEYDMNTVEEIKIRITNARTYLLSIKL